MRVRKLPLFVLLVLLTGTFYWALRRNLNGAISRSSLTRGGYSDSDESEFPSRPEPRPVASDREHPIELLVKDNEREHRAILDKQSKTLQEATKEYKRRYGMPPPPRFDDWFRMAKRRNVQFIDEFDTIHDSLLPFWGLKPRTIRDRARETIGGEATVVITIMIRGGKVTHTEGGPEWQRSATVKMMDSFVQYLPDMDLAFNTNDEPRVVVPRDQLDRLVALGKERQAKVKAMPHRNAFSAKTSDLTSGLKVLESKVSRFTTFAHQSVWSVSRLSCPIESPVRAIEESQAHDDLTAYAMGPLGFIQNYTAFTDICNTPALGVGHGFFERPNAYSVSHELMPVFSQSKVSSYQDILYPSPWYWSGKASYDEKKDVSWPEKAPKLWWVGSTTGGFSRRGGWRRQHRQRLVAKLNALDTAKIMRDEGRSGGGSGNSDSDKPASSRPALEGENPQWAVTEVERHDYAELMDVHFSHIGQCDDTDCDAQREFFTVVPAADFQTAWKSKFLLDIDGNAFSGRFYAFLRSRSLPVKMSVFREWHAEWIRPWAHYMPLSLRADEALEMIRYLAADAEGKRTAERVAEQGRMWAEQILRNDDLEIWFFRLLLEYGRVIDDERESIGFAG